MIRTIIKKNEYHDSVFLMNISEKIQSVEGVFQVVILMGTDTNKNLLSDVSMLTDLAKEAAPNDMIIVIEGSI